MHIAIADDWLLVLRGPALRETIEVDQPREHRVPFDGVEQLGVPSEVAAQAGRVGKERVRRNHQTALAPLQPRKIVERPHRVGAAAKIQQQHVAAFDRPLHSGNEDDAAVGGVGVESPEIELFFVKRHRQGVVAKDGGAIDQIKCRVGHRVDRIVAGVGMKLNLQHLASFLFTIRAGSGTRRVSQLEAAPQAGAERVFRTLVGA
ncbi:MAG TPA: hypothetical protein VKD69_18215 [Vicinamibacterales bacterium]|nr:hypothetical protein [Vicinamibacterales bacterium]